MPRALSVVPLPATMQGRVVDFLESLDCIPFLEVTMHGRGSLSQVRSLCGHGEFAFGRGLIRVGDPKTTAVHMSHGEPFCIYKKGNAPGVYCMPIWLQW